MQEPLSELAIQSSVRASEAGHTPEQSLQSADTLPALQPEGLEHQTSQIDLQHMSLQAENSAEGNCEGLSAAADRVKHSSDTYLPHTALLHASATMEQDHPLILQRPAADEPPESAGQLMAHHIGLSIETDITSTIVEEAVQQKHSIVGGSAPAPALQYAGRGGQPSFASLDGHAANATPSAAAAGVRDEGALTGLSSSRVAAHDLASIPTDAAGPPVHQSEDLEGTEPKQSSGLPAQKSAPIAEEGQGLQAQSFSAQNSSACCSVHDRSDHVGAAKQVVSAPAGNSVAAAAGAGSIAHSRRLQDTQKAQVSSEQDDSAEREPESQPAGKIATAEVNHSNWSEHSQRVERSDVPDSVVDGEGVSVIGSGTNAAEAAASDAESQSATQEELLALVGAVAQLEAQLAEARGSAARLEQEAHAVREEAAQWREREADASAQVQLLHALVTFFTLAVQPSLRHRSRLASGLVRKVALPSQHAVLWLCKAFNLDAQQIWKLIMLCSWWQCGRHTQTCAAQQRLRRSRWLSCRPPRGASGSSSLPPLSRCPRAKNVALRVHPTALFAGIQSEVESIANPGSLVDWASCSVVMLLLRKPLLMLAGACERGGQDALPS